MLEWLPKLTLPDLVVFLVTVFLCLAASRVGDAGDLVGRAWLRLFGRAPHGPTPPAAGAPPLLGDKSGGDAP